MANELYESGHMDPGGTWTLWKGVKIVPGKIALILMFGTSNWCVIFIYTDEVSNAVDWVNPIHDFFAAF